MDEPFLLMVARPNGSGKTTLIESLRKQGIDLGEYINPDDIAGQLTGSYDDRVVAAQSMANARRNECIDGRRSFTFETVMSHPSKLDVLVRGKEAGFFVQLFFVGIDDPRTNIERVALRVAQGGHDVPADKIVSRWKRTMEQLHEAIRSTDEAYIFDNSAAGTVETTPRLVFRRSFIKKRNLPRHEQYPPIPLWVRQYVLKPLGIDSVGGYSSFGPSRVLRSIITATGEQAKSTEQIEKLSVFRPPPHDIDLEQALIGTILVHNECFYKVCDFISLAEFYEPIHQKIFELAAQLIKGGKQASPNSLKAMFPVDIDIGGLTIGQYLARLAAESTTPAEAERSAIILLNLAVRRGLIAACEDTSNSAYDAANDADVRDLLEAAERRIYELAEPARYDTDGLHGFAHILTSAVDRIAQAYVSEEAISGISTGLADLDRTTGGLQKADLIVVGGKVGIGKTALVANIAYNVARAWKGEVLPDERVVTAEGGVVGYFSLDMSAEQLAMDIIANLADVRLPQIARGDISEVEFDRIATAAREIQTIPLYIDDTGALASAHIAARARRLKRRRGLDFLVVDSIHTTQPRSSERGIEEIFAEVFSALKLLAKEINIPILAVAQLPVSDYTKWRPELETTPWWAAIEQYSDLVLLVTRKDYDLLQREPQEGTESHLQWTRELDTAKGWAEIIVAKNRNGPTGTVNLHFSADYARFSDLA